MINSLKSGGFLVAALCGSLWISSANASTFDFSFISSDGPPPTVVGIGSFTATGTGPTFTVTGATGFVTDTDLFAVFGTSIFGITGVSPYAAADEALSFPLEPFVTFGGISIATNDGLGDIVDFNIYNLPGYHVLVSNFDPSGAPSSPPGDYAISLSITETPLPATWTMLIAGFVGLGFFAYRGSKKSAGALASA
jgi:hypothetical protein